MAVLITLAIVAVLAAVSVRSAANARHAKPRRQNFFGDYPRSVVAGLDSFSNESRVSGPEGYHR